MIHTKYISQPINNKNNNTNNNNHRGRCSIYHLCEYEAGICASPALPSYEPSIAFVIRLKSNYTTLLTNIRTSFHHTVYVMCSVAKLQHYTQGIIYQSFCLSTIGTASIYWYSCYYYYIFVAIFYY